MSALHPNLQICLLRSRNREEEMENNTTDILNKFDQFLASRNLSRDSEAASIRNQLKLMIQELQIVKNPCRRREKRSLCIVDRKCPACRCDPDSKGIIMANDGGSNVCRYESRKSSFREIRAALHSR